MRILIAPDKFKGSLGAKEVAENIAAGLREVLPDAIIEPIPVADGGEGTAEVIHDGLGGLWVTCLAHDPLGRPIEARYAEIERPDGNKLAVMEMSEAAGMRRLHRDEDDVERASTFGVGEMILHASRRGAQEVIVGLGGSATNDGGLGMARALGFRFLRADGGTVETVADLPRLATIDRSGAETVRLGPLASVRKIIAAADVRNPLLGEDGATRVFGPQKGAAVAKIERLERALARLADVVSRDLGCDYCSEPGAGAAGGLGFGLMSFCGAQLRSGFAVVADAIGLEDKIQAADVIVTGEGRLDSQTLEGKAPAAISGLARKYRKPIYAIVGQASSDRQDGELFDGVYELVRPPITSAEAMERTTSLLRERARELGSRLQAHL